MFRHLAIAVVVLLLSDPQSTKAQIGYSGGVFRETFNGLGTNWQRWTNNMTLPGWYAYRGGVDLTGASFGPVEGWLSVHDHGSYDGLDNFGTGPSDTNRSFGIAGGYMNMMAALVLRNDTTNIFEGFTLSFTGEQWRDPNAYGDRMDFSYGTFYSLGDVEMCPNSIVPSPQGVNASQLQDAYNQGYRNPRPDPLDFAAFHLLNGTSPGGKQPYNRRPVSGAARCCWRPGEYLVLRWTNWKYPPAYKASLAFDDLEFEPMPARGLVFTDIGRQPDGFAFFELCGCTSLTYRVEVSTNLVNWSPLATNMVPLIFENRVSGYRLFDQDSPGTPRRFYRGVSE